MNESAVNFRPRWFTNPETWILLTAVLAFLLKFDLALRTFGTNDVAIFYKLIVFFIFSLRSPPNIWSGLRHSCSCFRRPFRASVVEQLIISLFFL